MATLGQKLKKIRKEQRLSQSAVAEKAHITSAFLSMVEKDQKFPSISTLLGICEVLGVEPGELLTSNPRLTTRTNLDPS